MKDNKLNLLITGVGGDIGQGVIKCLLEIDYHSNLVGCDIDKYAAGKMSVDKFYKVPKARQEKEFIEKIYGIVKANNIECIIPTTEQEIKVFNKYREYFNKDNIELLINNSMIIDTFLDKYKTIQFFKHNNILCPKTYIIEEYNGQIQFPVIAKLRESSGAKGVFKIKDQQELEYFKTKYNNAIIQEIVGEIDNEYTIGIFSDGKTTHYIAFKRYLGFGSLSKYVELVDDCNIKELAEEISSITKLRGSINVQARKVGNSYIPFEINPRISSTVYFRHYFGFQDVKWWLDSIVGNKIEYIQRYKKGIGVRTLGEVFFELS